MNRLNPLTRKYFVISLLFPAYLSAVEGKDPIPEIELPRPELKEEEIRIAVDRKFPRLYLEAGFGEDELGRGYRIELDGQPGINRALQGHFLKLEDKISVGAEMEKRVISSWWLAEVDAQVGAYRMGEDWTEYEMFHGSVSMYCGENVFKVLGSGSHESKLAWDAGILWGRPLWETVFVGLGVSGPRYIAPLVQINWSVNQSLLVSVSYRSKEVTSTLNSIYMSQPHVIQNTHLEPEQWNALSTAEFTFLNLLTVGMTYKEIENAICWRATRCQGLERSVEPVNATKFQSLSGHVDIEWKGIRNHVSFEHRHLYDSRSKCPDSCFWTPLSLLAQTEIPCPYDMKIKLGSTYVGEKTIWQPPRVMQDYWLLSMSFSKRLNSMDFWIGANNVTNTEYEVVPGVWEQGCHLEAGVTVTFI